MGKFSLFLASILVLINLKSLEDASEISVVGYCNFTVIVVSSFVGMVWLSQNVLLSKPYLVLMVLL